MTETKFSSTLRLLMETPPITTQAQLAEITGKTRQTISQYVNGISEPGYDTLVKIADYFDVPLDYLLGRGKENGVHIEHHEAKADQGKNPLALVPTKIIRAIGRVRQYGTEKYGDPENWKKVEAKRYRNALYRHWLNYLDDPKGKDEESGLPHLWHLACNAAFLIEMEDE